MKLMIGSKYAEENLEAAKILLKSHLYNPCLQNLQQSSEKYLKALCIELSMGLKKTHNIHELIMLLRKAGKEIVVSEDECDLLDFDLSSIKISSQQCPSKLRARREGLYPMHEDCFENCRLYSRSSPWISLCYN
ncbi:MAG: HEPN domain-containing protein [Chlamydiae bacterium]|nr:HEPN domain-containing protein [Chlamydiota bacterium]MBI3276127.1 HEPN domain-containing protein [Chlamydiota bacterium]